MEGLETHEIALFFLSLGLLLTSARILGEVAQRLGQPSILGEILAGIILGPTILGSISPDLCATLFPLNGPRAIAMDGLSTLAITLFLLVVGMEVDLSTIWRQGRTVIFVGTGGLVVPFVLSFTAAWAMPELLGREPTVEPLIFALFMGTAMSITAVPVISKTLMDLGLYRTDLGMIIVAGGISNDLAGWILFAVILGMMEHAASSGLMVWQTMTLTLGFVVLMLTIGRALVHRALPWIQAHTSWPGGVLGFSLGLSLLAASFTEAIGVHAVLGSFLLGVIVGDSSHLREQTRTVIAHFISFIFAPLFFAMIGLRINFFINFDLFLLLLMLVLACVGKLVGCGFGARLSGLSKRESWAVGFAMNARGSMEIVLGTLALESGIISERVFEALVIVALATAVVPGPAMQVILKRRRPIRAIDFLTAKTFVGRLSGTSRLQAIREMSESVAAVLGLEPQRVADAVWQREQTMATGLGHGVAIPHARLAEAEKSVVAVGLSPQGLDFDAPDGAPVHLVFMVVTPVQDNGVQLQILADVSRTCMRPAFMERAAGVDGYTEFLALLNTSVGEI